MHRLLTFRRLSVIFLALFAVLTAGVLVAQRFWIDPVERCEGSGSWWFAEERRCVTPIYIPDITGRAEGVTRAQASAEKNRELAVEERRAVQEKAALGAEVRRQREALER